jgi:heat shock protein HtpX
MSQFYNNVKTALLLGLMTGLILLIGALIGGQRGVLYALIFAAVMNFVSYFFSDKIALSAMRAQEVGPDHELYQIVEELTRKDNLPMPRVYVSPTDAPNAFATGRNPRHAAVCATAGILRMLDRNELLGVMGHELSHVKHRDILITSIAATIAAAISYIGYLIWWGGGRDENRSIVTELAILFLAPLAAALIQAAISRSREFNADKAGAELCGNPMYLATALEKIDRSARRIPIPVNPSFNGMFIIEPLNAWKSMAGLFQTHPPLEARLMNLIGRESTGQFAGVGRA